MVTRFPRNGECVYVFTASGTSQQAWFIDDVVENPQHPHYCNPPQFLYIDCLLDMEPFCIYKSVANVLLISKRPKRLNYLKVHASLVQIHSRLELQDANRKTKSLFRQWIFFIQCRESLFRPKNAKTIKYMTDGVLHETLKDVDDNNYLVIVVDEAHVIFEQKQQVVRVVYTRALGLTLVYAIAAIFLETTFWRDTTGTREYHQFYIFVYVGNPDPVITEDELRPLFMCFGDIVHTRFQ
ncbi:hypothetical protein Tco_1324123 [Tanacetum coccineum]